MSFASDLVGVLPMVIDFLTCYAFVLLMLHKFLIWVISVDGGAIRSKIFSVYLIAVFLKKRKFEKWSFF